MTEEQVRITYIANAGIRIDYRGTTFLVDALFSAHDLPVANLSEEQMLSLISASPPFDEVDYILVTHDHPDHFSPELLLRYLQNHPVKGVFLPEQALRANKGLAEHPAWYQTPLYTLPTGQKTIEYTLSNGITLRCVCTHHLDKKFVHIQHWCYLFRFGEKRVLLTGDFDYIHEDLSEIGERDLSAVFVNPLSLRAMFTSGMFRGKIDAETVVVYHMPPPDEQKEMHRMVDADVQKIRFIGKNTILFREQMQGCV